MLARSKVRTHVASWNRLSLCLAPLANGTARHLGGCDGVVVGAECNDGLQNTKVGNKSNTQLIDSKVVRAIFDGIDKRVETHDRETVCMSAVGNPALCAMNK